MPTLKKCLNAIEKFLMVLIGILLGVMVAVISYQVILRYVFSRANAWADELARYTLIWLIMLAAPVGFRRYCHIRIDVFIRRIPEKMRRIIEFGIYILELVFFFVMAWSSVVISERVKGQASAGIGIPMSYIYISGVIGAAFSIIFILENMYNEFIVPFMRAGKSKRAMR